MKNNRPVNLDLATIRFPITAIVSITHRITGMVLLLGALVFLAMFDMSLASEQSFNELKTILDQVWAKFILWAILAALAYHFAAGIRHLIMDMGFGETLESGKLGAKVMVACAVVLILLAGVWVW